MDPYVLRKGHTRRSNFHKLYFELVALIPGPKGNLSLAGIIKLFLIASKLKRAEREHIEMRITRFNNVTIYAQLKFQ